MLAAWPTRQEDVLMTERHHERIHRAMRYIGEQSRSRGDEGMQCVFDLLTYLSTEARVVVETEVTNTLADIVGGD